MGQVNTPENLRDFLTVAEAAAVVGVSPDRL